MGVKDLMQIEIVEVSKMIIRHNRSDGVVVIATMSDGKTAELNMSQMAISQLEALLAKAVVEQAKGQKKQ